MGGRKREGENVKGAGREPRRAVGGETGRVGDNVKRARGGNGGKRQNGKGEEREREKKEVERKRGGWGGRGVSIVNLLYRA